MSTVETAIEVIQVPVQGQEGASYPVQVVPTQPADGKYVVQAFFNNLPRMIGHLFRNADGTYEARFFNRTTAPGTREEVLTKLVHTVASFK